MAVNHAVSVVACQFIEKDEKMISIPKPKKIKSRKIRQSAKGRNCTLRIPGICNHDSGTVSLCHLNSNQKGAGNKSHDIHSIIACNKCHDWLDMRGNEWMRTDLLELNREAEKLRALLETQDIFIQEGLIQVA